MTPWQKIRTAARKIKAQVLMLWFCSRHPDTPLAAKLLAGFVVGYALSPIDLIPDFIPVLGYLDEIILLPICIYVALRLIPDQVLEEARVQADQWQHDRKGKPRNYVAAAVIVVIWLWLAWWAWRFCATWFGVTPGKP